MKTTATTGAPGPFVSGWFIVAVGVLLLWLWRNRIASAAYRANGFPAGY